MESGSPIRIPVSGELSVVLPELCLDLPFQDHVGGVDTFAWRPDCPKDCGKSHDFEGLHDHPIQVSNYSV